MPSKRRGGFAPPELRGTLGTLLRTTTGVVRDALERGAREGRARLDDARANRRRQDTLADLGELVLDLIRRGEIDLAELPEARDLVRQLDDLDAETDDPPPPPPRPSSRRRFDDRPAPSSAASKAAASTSGPRRADRPGPGPASAANAASTSDGTVSSTSDGTVSSGLGDRTMRPTIPARPKQTDPASTRGTPKPTKGLWRPRFEDEPDPQRAPAVRGSSATAPPPAAAITSDEPDRRRPPLPNDPHRKGGISFDDDDLDEYMHPDDVPPKPPAKPADPDDGDA